MGFLRHARLVAALACALVAAAPPPARATAYDDNPFLAIGAVRFDVRKEVAAQIPAGWRHAGGGADPYRLVKFSGPVGSGERETLAAAGYAVIATYPIGGFLVRPAAGRVAEDLTSLDRVIWVGPFHPYFKIHERLAEAWALDDPRPFLGADPGWGLRFVVGLHEESGRPAVEDSVAAAPGALSLLPTRGPIRVRVDAGRFQSFLTSVAALPQVAFIEPWLPVTVFNDENVQTGQSGSCNDNGSESPNTPIFNHGITGWGSRLVVADTCTDTNEGWFYDDMLDRLPAHEPNAPWTAVPADWAQRKIVEYYDMYSGDSTIGCAGSVGCGSGCPDHGTHVGGTMVANCNLDPEGIATATNPANSNGDNDGMAPGAKLFVQDLGNGTLDYLNVDGGDLGELLTVAFQNTCQGGSCFIDAHNNSWGAPSDQYQSIASSADAALWDLKNLLVVVSAGNSGSGFNTIGTPGVAKNVVAVGNAENCSVNDIRLTSSRGDTSDGRLKPDVMATGGSVTSAQNDGNGTTTTNGGCQLLTIGGTSMASPTVAGLSALMLQYFRDGFYPSGSKNAADSRDLSGPLRKALLINSAQRMTGVDAERSGVTWPNMDQGWGYVVLDNALYFSGDARNLWVHDEVSGVDVSGTASLSFQRRVTSAAQPLKVTLSWYDVEHSGSCGGGMPCMLNDLDLTVTNESNAVVYRTTLVAGTTGHVVPRTLVPSAPGVGQTTTNNGPDDLNTTEQIIVYSPTLGAIYTFTVTAANTPNGPIPFGLVATGALDDPCDDPAGAAGPAVADLDACANSGVLVSWNQDPAAWNDLGVGARSYRVLRDGTPIASGGCAGSFPYGTTSCVDNSGPNGFSVGYRVEYTSGCGGQVTSAAAVGTDRIAHTVNVKPDGLSTTCVQSSLVFSATAAPPTLGFVYQWTEDGLDIPGATTSSLSVTKSAAESHSYNCRISHPPTGCVSVDSASSSGAWTTDAANCPPSLGEVSGAGSGHPLQVQEAGSLVNLTFENIGAQNYNVYVSTLPSTLSFAVSTAAGKKDCDVAWLPALGGKATVTGYDVTAGIATGSSIYYILVTGDNGSPTEGPLGFTSSGVERTADSYCAK